MLDTTMTLPDGRVLGYTALGAAGGPLVFYFHGAPSSRLDLTVFDEAFTDAGVRVVCPDRPGYGTSSPQPGRARNDWPTDVAALADHLETEHFAVMGLSSGGPYAVACAALLPDRVGAAAVIAGVTDLTWPDGLDGYDDVWIAIMDLGDEVKAKQWCDEQFGPDGSGLMAGVPELSPPDHAVLADPAFTNGFGMSIAEAFRQGTGGFAQDMTIEGRQWAFDPATIVTPVRVIHGDQDTLVPLAHARHTAELIPGARLEIRPDHGHISLLTELPQLTTELTAALH